MTFKTIPIVSKEEVIPPLPSSLLELYDLDWREFLRRKNYNQHINKMCDLCIKDQISKYGEQTIKCSGIKDFETMFPKEIVETLDLDELDAAKELIDPYFWADRHLDTRQENPEKRIFSRRWYQEFMTKCSAPRKTIRCGRRVGKSYSIALDCTHRMITNPGYRILVVTPYLVQAKELSELVRTMLRHLDVGSWDDLVERSVTAPNHEIKLENGSIFKAFTAGNDGGSVRGQGADLVILDEADFLTQEAFNSVGAILADRKDTELICTSTPNGENLLFKLSQAPEYKEFHFPTFVLPHYSDELDKDFRSNSDIGGYIEEFCIEENQEVLTNVGPKKIKDLCVGDTIYSKDKNTTKVWQAPRKTGDKQVYKYTTLIPYVNITCTDDHRFPDRKNSKVKISELNELEVFIPKYKNNSRDERLARIIGYNLGDGTITSTEYSTHMYSSKAEDMELVADDFRSVFSNWNGSVKHYLVRNDKKTKSLVKVNGDRYTVSLSTIPTKELISLGCIRGKKVEQEFNVPDFILNGTREIKIEFLGGLFGAGGRTPRVEGVRLGTIPLVMCKRIGIDGSGFFNQLNCMLLELGIKSTVTSFNRGNNTVYTLTVLSEEDNYLKFLEVVGYRYCVRKELEALKHIAYVYHKKDESNKISKFIKECKEMYKAGHSFSDIYESYKDSKTRSQVAKAIHRTSKTTRAKTCMKYNHFNAMISSSSKSIYLPIKNIEDAGVRPVYNLGVDSSDTSYLMYSGIRTFNCAIFGLDTSTAFQAEFIDRARMHEQTNPDIYLRNRNNYIMALGCDWNGDKVGTRICITAYNKTTGKISIAKMDNVSKEGWTQVAAVKKIIELNRLYNIDHIYVDEGFGEANVQALKLHAVNNYGKLPYDHPDLRLDEVVAVNFASTLELRDIVTGEIRKKYYKNFMVETVNRGLETEALDLSGRIADDVVKQMKNYVIKSTTSNGRKIYEAKDHEIGDHDLDAYMLAVTALHLEHNSILDQREISNIQILPIEKSTNNGYNEASSIGNRITDGELNRVASNLFYSYKNNMPSVGRTDSITNSRGGVLGKSRAIMSSRSTRSRLLSGR